MLPFVFAAIAALGPSSPGASPLADLRAACERSVLDPKRQAPRVHVVCEQDGTLWRPVDDTDTTPVTSPLEKINKAIVDIADLHAEKVGEAYGESEQSTGCLRRKMRFTTATFPIDMSCSDFLAM